MAPVRVMSPFFAVASTPTATVRPRVSASFAVAARAESSISVTAGPGAGGCVGAGLRVPVPSAGDVQVVTDVVDAGGHPRRVDDRVVLGPGADVAGQRDRVAAGVHGHVAVVRDQRVPVQGVLHVQGDVDRVGVGADVDVVLDVAD